LVQSLRRLLQEMADGSELQTPPVSSGFCLPWRWKGSSVGTDLDDGLQSLTLGQATNCTNPPICGASPRRKPLRSGRMQKAGKYGEACLLHSLCCGIVKRQRGNKPRNVCLLVSSCRYIKIPLNN